MNAQVHDNDQSLREAGISFVTNALDLRRQPDRLLQCNQTPSVELWRDGIASVRYYPPLLSSEIRFDGDTVDVRPTQFDIPILLVPPLGVHAWVYDLLNERSWVRYFLSQGFKVYLLDWGTVRKQDSDLTLEDYVLRWLPQATEAVRKHSGQQDISMMGYCMGGLLSLMYLAATEDKQVRNLVTVASPVDFHRLGLQGLI
ncbi:MAG TPA: alpha/beta fold hydrolase, partial [Pseudomonadales bacterium]|nr:alpha/beta fold hydrolase [Pseudomonadales bacterium]